MVPPKPALGLDMAGFGRLPVLVYRRVMPMDPLARISLSIIRGRQTYETAEGKKAPAIQWLMEILMAPERVDNLRILLVTNPDVLGLFGWSNRKDKMPDGSTSERHCWERSARGTSPIRSRPILR